MPSRKRHRQTQKSTSLVANEPTNRVWLVDSPELVPRLVEEVFSPSRYRPLLVLSQASDTNRTRVDVESLSEAVTDNALVAVLASGDTTWAFTNNVPEHFRVFGGGTRLFWPYARAEDAPDRHPLFITKDEATSSKTVAYIVKALRDTGYLPEPENAVQQPPWEVENESSQDADKVSSLLADLDLARDRIAALTSENADLRKTVHGLTDQVSSLKQRLHGTNVYSDATQQLRHEIDQAWLVTYSEADRVEHPLAMYTFGVDFVSSVELIEGVERDKVVSTCVDVLTRRAWEVNGRKARQFRSSPAPGSAYLVRAEDNATAWRCNIQTSTASARRLMWWEVPDGSIELAVVALHDAVDMR